MENIFDDYQLNTKANTIINTIERTTSPISAGGMMSSFNDNGLIVAKNLLDVCLPELQFIKNNINPNDPTYLELSDALAVTTSAIIKMPVNSISMLANTSGFHSNQENVLKRKSELANATKMMSIISNFDLSQRARSTINENLSRLNEAQERVNRKSGGCYIASCVYGSYNSKEVLILRSYRDNVLSKTLAGRISIKLYYFFSPIVVDLFGKSASFRKIVKPYLDGFILKITQNVEYK